MSELGRPPNPYERIDALEVRVRQLEAQVVALAAAMAVNAANLAGLLSALGSDAIPGEHASQPQGRSKAAKAN